MTTCHVSIQRVLTRLPHQLCICLLRSHIIAATSPAVAQLPMSLETPPTQLRYKISIFCLFRTDLHQEYGILRTYISGDRRVFRPAVPSSLRLLSHIHSQSQPISATICDDTMAPPSSCIISGVFSLFDGSRDPNTRYHVTYFSPLDSADTSIPVNVSVRKYTALVDPIYEEGSLVFVIGKAALSAGGDILLDSIHCASFDPSVEALPADLTHTAFIAGLVSAVDDSLPARRSFTLAVSEYVRDERRAFHVRFVFDTTFSFFSTYTTWIPVSSSMAPPTGGRTRHCHRLDQRLSLPVPSRVPSSRGTP